MGQSRNISHRRGQSGNLSQRALKSADRNVRNKSASLSVFDRMFAVFFQLVTLFYLQLEVLQQVPVCNVSTINVFFVLCKFCCCLILNSVFLAPAIECLYKTIELLEALCIVTHLLRTCEPGNGVKWECSCPSESLLQPTSAVNLHWSNSAVRSSIYYYGIIWHLIYLMPLIDIRMHTVCIWQYTYA